MKQVIVIASLFVFIQKCFSQQSVGINTSAPEYTLHVKDSSVEASAGINATGTAQKSLLNLSIDNRINGNSLLLLKYRPGVTGLIAGIPKSNLSILEADAGAGPLLIATNQNSNIHFATNRIERMRITNTGHVGINNTNPSLGWLHVENNDNASSIFAINRNTAANAFAISASILSSSGAAVSGSSITGSVTSGFITGRYGVLGTSGGGGIGVGGFTINGGTAIKAQVVSGGGTAIYSSGNLKFTGIGEAANKVLTSDASGNATWQNLPPAADTNKFGFTVTASPSNISANLITLNYAGMSATDIIIVTHIFSDNYIGATGTWWDGSEWTIFREDRAAMHDGEKFNVLVIKE